MTTSIIPAIENYYTLKQQQDYSIPYCTIQWRRDQLLVMPVGQLKQPHMPTLAQMQLLVECIKRCPVNLVRIDPKLGETKVRFWADACLAANKPIFLRIPCAHRPKGFSSPLLSALKRLTDWFLALILLLALSPVMLGLVGVMRVYSPGQMFSRQWHVGERGRLFKAIKFRTTTVSENIAQDSTADRENLCDRSKDGQAMALLARWIREYGLDNLPQLLNVLRFEMSLTGPRCWSLEDAVRLSLQGQRELNSLPGFTSLWHQKQRFKAVESGCGETF